MATIPYSPGEASKPYATADVGKSPYFAGSRVPDLRILIVVSPTCRETRPEYNVVQEVESRADARGGDLFLRVGASRSRHVEGAVMIDLLDFVSLSLLPSWCWRVAADWLRNGDAPAVVSRRLIAACAEVSKSDPPDVRAIAAHAIQRASASSIAGIPWSAPSYPVALTTITDPPPVLWTRGCLDALSVPAVAIVGSRAASPYGLAVAGQLAADLAARGLAIVSGLARGVDSAAHRGALSAGGVTIAVLGSGVDVVYPPEHAPLAADIDETGAVVSELVPGTRPLQWFFPMRNRIISGLSRAVVVIEAGEKSGSLITARCALDQGRDVLAVPGNILSGRNRGAHALLRDGAKIVESADDILEELGLATVSGAAEGGADRGQATPDAAVDPVLGCLVPGEASALDEIAERSGVRTPRLLPRLFELELQGLVRRAGGGRFMRTDRTC
jgi:DNA processing protein